MSDLLLTKSMGLHEKIIHEVFMKYLVSLVLFLSVNLAWAQISSVRIDANLKKDFQDASVWKSAPEAQSVTMMGQPAIAPRSKDTNTAEILVSSVNDGEWIAFKLVWKCDKPEAGGRLATASDAVALEFPVKDNQNPPSVIMGAKDDPVHMFHWRYQYQLDALEGKKGIEDLYPNMPRDNYEDVSDLDPKLNKELKRQRNEDVGGVAAGNPQAFPKDSVDELLAEGFGTSAVLKDKQAKAYGEWKDGQWTVYLSRPLNYKEGSKLIPGEDSNIGFAVWQGGKKEVGSLKSITFLWTPLKVLK